MIQLIIDEYNKWVENPNEYLNSSLYTNGYDPNFPPLQIMGNLLSEEEIKETMNPNSKIDKKSLDTKNSNKILIIGLEPLISNPDNPDGTYQQQYKRLYKIDDNSNIEIQEQINNGGIKGISELRTDIDLESYLNWNLNYFNFFQSILKTKYRGHWKYLSHFCLGLDNSNFQPNTNTNWNLIGEKIIELDIIPMHGINRHQINDHIIELFKEKIHLIKPKNILILGGKKVRESILRPLFNLTDEEINGEAIYESENENSKINKIKLCSDSLNAGIFMRNSFAARGSGNGFEDANKLGKKILEHM